MKMVKKTIKIYESKVNYCGCMTCKNICPTRAINMKSDEEGFFYPHINQEICIDCGLCRKVCPMINSGELEVNIDVYGCKNKDEKEKYNSASGGLFSVLSRDIINRGGVVYGAAFDTNFQVKHIAIDNTNDLDRLRRSKYVQSDTGKAYREVKELLANDRKLLFSGTPCQIAGLKNFLGQNTKNLYLVDVICHGVPSPGVFEKYLDYYVKKYKSDIENINFCAKEKSIKALKIEFSNGKVYLKGASKDLYYKAFSDTLILRPSCYNCMHNNFRSGSDISLADYWGASERFQDYQEKTEGVSLAVIKTKKGRELFYSVTDKIEFVETTIEHAIKGNPNIIQSSKMNTNRELFFKDYQNNIEITRILKKHTKVNLIPKIIPKIRYDIKKYLR